MCTVTYLPLSNTSFLLTHNRDEHITRSIALLPEKYTIANLEVVFPKDVQGGGTWIATSKLYTLCLLNGGFEKHIPSPPYKHSRGLVLTDFFSFLDIERFKNEYSFTDLEAFTLIIIKHFPQQIHQIVWNGNEIFYETKDDNDAHIWSSASLYSEAERMKRKIWFQQWKRQQLKYAQQNIIEFHKQKYDQDQLEGILINRDAALFTVSMTSILKEERQISLSYEDFIKHKAKQLVI